MSCFQVLYRQPLMELWTGKRAKWALNLAVPGAMTFKSRTVDLSMRIVWPPWILVQKDTVLVIRLDKKKHLSMYIIFCLYIHHFHLYGAVITTGRSRLTIKPTFGALNYLSFQTEIRNL